MPSANFQWDENHKCQYYSMSSSYKPPSPPITYQEVIKWTSICTIVFGLVLVFLDSYSMIRYAVLSHLWYPGFGLGASVICTGTFGVLATQKLFPPRQPSGYLSITFLTSGCLSILYSSAMIIYFAVFFPDILDDRTDRLQALKHTIIAAYVVSFAFSAIETLFSLRCIYAEYYERTIESQPVEFSPLVVTTTPFLNLGYERDTDSVPTGSGAKKEFPDVYTYLCPNDLPSSDDDEENDVVAGEKKTAEMIV